MKRYMILIMWLISMLSNAQQETTIRVSEPGTLSSIITNDEKNNTYKLTVLGNLDARDFKTIRNEIPNLKIIDLSETFIVAYSGVNGTLAYNSNYPESEVPSNAFSEKSNCTTIILPKTAISIGDYTFNNCKFLSDLSLPEKLTKIGNFAFNNCNSLTSLILPNKVTIIYDCFLNGCNNIKKITLKNNIPVNLSSKSFYGFSPNKCTLEVPLGSLAAYQNAEYWKLFSIVESGSTSITTKKNVDVELAGSLSTLLTLSEQNNIKNLTITGVLDARDFKFLRDSMNVLDSLDIENVDIYEYSGIEGPSDSNLVYAANAFPTQSFNYSYSSKGKVSLRYVKCPISMESIGHSAFYGCTGLESIILFSQLKNIGQLALYGCSSLSTIEFPESLTVIGSFAFSECINLKSLQIPQSSKIKHIGNYAFKGCSNLSGYYYLTQELDFLGIGAFKGCSNINGIFFFDTLSEFKSETFQQCSSITDFYIPRTVTKIGDYFLSDTYKLTKLYCKNPIPPILDSKAFLGLTQSSCTLYVQKGTKNAYLSKEGWNKFINIVEIDYGYEQDKIYRINVHFNDGGNIQFQSANLMNGSYLDVLNGNSLTLMILPNEGYMIDSILLNNNIVNNEIINGSFTIPNICSDSNLKVVFKKIQYRLAIKYSDTGTINLICNYHDTPSFDFTPSLGWELYSVIYNNNNLTTTLVNGILKLPELNADAIISVVFRETIAGKSDNIVFSNNIQIYTLGNEIIIDNLLQNNDISVYTLNGVLLEHKKNCTKQAKFRVHSNSVYIIKINSETFKICT